MEIMKGKFIVIDGPDGSGIDTQTKRTALYIFDKRKDNHICLTREPFKSEHYQRIREFLNSGADPRANAEKLAELFVADRRVHEAAIRSHLDDGYSEVSARYKYATFAFQQAQGLAFGKLLAMHSGILVPDLAIILDVPTEVALARIAADVKSGKRTHKEVFEQPEFQGQVRRNFLALPGLLPKENIVVVNGNRPVEQVFEDIRKEVDKIL